MRSVAVIFFCLVLCTSFAQQKSQPKKKPSVKYWEELSEKERASILADSALSKNISDLYNGKFYFTDSKENIALLNELVSLRGALLPLRIYLFSKLIAANDTALRGLLNEYSVKMAYNQPDMLMRYFSKEHQKKNDVYKKFIPFFAADLDEKVEFGNFKDFMDLYFFSANADIKQMLMLICKACEKAGAGSKNPVPIPLPPKGNDD